MTTAPRLRPFEAERDEAVVRRILSLSFGGTPEGAGTFLDRVGRETMRMLDDGAAESTACLARIPMGQFFGGRSVPMAGIAAVGVAPEARGGGKARALMRACMQELAADGVPISCLYASTQALYRQVGFEQAGAKFDVRIPLRQLTEGTRDLRVTPVDIDDPRVRECYRGFARRFDGMLDRGDYAWQRVRQNREQVFQGFGVIGASAKNADSDSAPAPLEGYVFLHQQRRPDDGRHDVVLSDVVFTTRRAGARLLGFLRDFTSMGLQLSFAGGPSHPLVLLLQQQWIEVAMRDYWMIRIVNLPAAIAARGYPVGIDVDVVVEVADELLPGNSGRWRLRVTRGAGEATRTDRAAAIRTTPNGLAAMFAGYVSPLQATILGFADGDDDALRALAPAFAGTGPWMSDHF